MVEMSVETLIFQKYRPKVGTEMERPRPTLWAITLFTFLKLDILVKIAKNDIDWV